MTTMPTQPAPALILASASPRRQRLLGFLGLSFAIRTSEAEEQDTLPPPAQQSAVPPCPLPQADHPTLRAWRKVHDIRQQQPAPTPVVLGADTVVVHAGEALNKPADAAHARAMLTRLAGTTHTVYTGLCAYAPHQGYLFDLVASQVTLAPLDEHTIHAYVATGEPLDKAGSYGIQGLGGKLVQQVAGSYTAVVGLPLPATALLLRHAGLTVPVRPEDAYHTWLGAERKEALPCPPTQP